VAEKIGVDIIPGGSRGGLELAIFRHPGVVLTLKSIPWIYFANFQVKRS